MLQDNYSQMKSEDYIQEKTYSQNQSRDLIEKKLITLRSSCSPLLPSNYDYSKKKFDYKSKYKNENSKKLINFIVERLNQY